MEDPLDNQIVNSGDFVHQGDKIGFSSYTGYSMHKELIVEMARKLPKEIILLVIGFDMDNYPDPTGGEILELEGQTGHEIRYSRYPSEWIAKYHFPLLFTQLTEENTE